MNSMASDMVLGYGHMWDNVSGRVEVCESIDVLCLFWLIPRVVSRSWCLELIPGFYIGCGV